MQNSFLQPQPTLRFENGTLLNGFYVNGTKVDDASMYAERVGWTPADIALLGMTLWIIVILLLYMVARYYGWVPTWEREKAPEPAQVALVNIIPPTPPEQVVNPPQAAGRGQGLPVEGSRRGAMRRSARQEADWSAPSPPLASSPASASSADFNAEGPDADLPSPPSYSLHSPQPAGEGK